MDIEIEMSVEQVMDLSANEDEPKGVNGDARRARRIGIGHHHSPRGSASTRACH